jgi:hypothetical protein
MSDNEPQPNSPDRPAGVASACANDESEPPQGGYQPIDTHNALSGRDLRYVLTSYIDAGYNTVKTLVRKLAEDGYTVWGRASKVVSDALRWEIRNGRVQRLRRGVYGINEMPRSTRHRIRARARDLLFLTHVVATWRDALAHSGPVLPPSPDRRWREWSRSRQKSTAGP